MVYSRPFGFDQWVASIWRHVGLGVGVKKTKNPSVAIDEYFRDGMRSYFCSWAMGMILVVLVLGWKKKETPSLVVETCLSASENPLRSKSVDCSVCRVATPCGLGIIWALLGEVIAFFVLPSPMWQVCVWKWNDDDFRMVTLYTWDSLVCENWITLAFWVCRGPPAQWGRFVRESGRTMTLWVCHPAQLAHRLWNVPKFYTQLSLVLVHCAVCHRLFHRNWAKLCLFLSLIHKFSSYPFYFPATFPPLQSWLKFVPGKARVCGTFFSRKSCTFTNSQPTNPRIFVCQKIWWYTLKYGPPSWEKWHLRFRGITFLLSQSARPYESCKNI